jgi:hypothetical protein
MENMNTIIKVGSIITNKRILYKFKRKGFIWEYSQWGYIEDLRIKTKSGVEFTLELSSNGKCKEGEKLEGAMYEKWRQRQAETNMSFDECHNLFGDNEFNFEGMVFTTKYIDGCFHPYLVRIK